MGAPNQNQHAQQAGGLENSFSSCGAREEGHSASHGCAKSESEQGAILAATGSGDRSQQVTHWSLMTARLSLFFLGAAVTGPAEALSSYKCRCLDRHMMLLSKLLLT